MNNDIITIGVASVSWIDRRAGLPESTSDPDPGRSVSRSFLVGKKGYRFANFLEATVHVLRRPGLGGVEQRDVAISQFTNASGLYPCTSFLGTRVEEFKSHREMESVAGYQHVPTQTILPAGTRFRQTVGARTAASEKVGRTAGKYIGYAAGVFGGPAGAVAGYLAGRHLGRELAEEVTALPPIWSELELTIYADGTFEYLAIGHSLFPSVTFYTVDHTRSLKTGRGIPVAHSSAYTRFGDYDGVPQIDRWMEHGWGQRRAGNVGGHYDGNTWRIPSPHGFGDQRRAEHEAAVVE